MKMYLFFSHIFTDDQIESSKQDLGITELIYLPKKEQEEWSNINPEIANVDIPIIEKFVDENLKTGDVALIQGDWGATFKLVLKLKKKGVKTVYSTNRRKIIFEKIIDTKEVKKVSIFEHVIYREYKG